MVELTNKSDINVLELLLKISNDVSSIKTDMNNLKESQAKERDIINKDIMDVRDDCLRETARVETTLMTRINSLQSVQNNLVGDIDELKHADEKKDATRWKIVMSFVLTAVGGMVIAKLPDIISYLMLLSAVKGGN